jgi:hypothetical protein
MRDITCNRVEALMDGAKELTIRRDGMKFWAILTDGRTVWIGDESDSFSGAIFKLTSGQRTEKEAT